MGAPKVGVKCIDVEREGNYVHAHNTVLENSYSAGH